MFKEKFGIEIEFTGITRNKAAKLVAEYLNGTVSDARIDELLEEDFDIFKIVSTA